MRVDVRVSVCDSVLVLDCELENVGDLLAVAACVADWVAVTVGVLDWLAVAVCVGVCEGEAVPAVLLDADAPRDTDTVAIMLVVVVADSVGDCVKLDVVVGDCVCVTIGVMVTAAVATDEGVCEAVTCSFVGVTDGVTSEEPVGDGVYAIERVFVLVCVVAGVELGVAEDDTVHVGVTTAETEDVLVLAAVEDTDAATVVVRVLVPVNVFVNELEIVMATVNELDGVCSTDDETEIEGIEVGEERAVDCEKVKVFVCDSVLEEEDVREADGSWGLLDTEKETAREKVADAVTPGVSDDVCEAVWVGDPVLVNVTLNDVEIDGVIVLVVVNDQDIDTVYEGVVLMLDE